jgi:hypothetical protein
MMKKITIVIFTLLLLLSIGYVWAEIETKEEGSNLMVRDHKKEAIEKIAGGIRAKMCDGISGEYKRLIKKQVDPWIFYNSKGVHVKKFGDGNISMSGIEYKDQSKAVFFSHIEPYIEDVVKRMIEGTIELAKSKKVPMSTVLGSTKANLSCGIDTVYHKMQNIDRRLRGGGDPESVPMRDVSFEIKKMNEFLDEQIKIAEDLHVQIPEPDKEKAKRGLLYWVAIIVAIATLIILFFGDNILVRISKKFKSNEPAIKQIETPMKKDEQAKQKIEDIDIEQKGETLSDVTGIEMSNNPHDTELGKVKVHQEGKDLRNVTGMKMEFDGNSGEVELKDKVEIKQQGPHGQSSVTFNADQPGVKIIFNKKSEDGNK